MTVDQRVAALEQGDKDATDTAHSRKALSARYSRSLCGS
jgi:hypothetical protein